MTRELTRELGSRTHIFVILAALFLVSTVGLTPVHAAPTGGDVGVLDTRIHDVDGRLHRLGEEVGYGPISLVFLDTECPISRRFIPELNAMADEASPRGVQLYGVLSDPTLTAARAREFQQEFQVDFPLLWDSSGDLALRLAPTVVPEAFVIDGADRVVYRGRIDNRFESPGRLRGTITETDLADAIDAAASGRAPEVAASQPVGCIFEAWNSYEPAQATYEREVAPLLQSHCTECHTAGGIGPFALDSYEAVKRRAGMVAWAASERFMPPWKAEEGFGHFRSQRLLSDRQIEVLNAWARSDLARGSTEDSLPFEPRSSADWRHGTPDLTIEMPEAFDIPAAGEDIYRYFVVPGGLANGAMITGLDFRPGDPSVVHHAIYYVDYGRTARRLDEAQPGPGFSAFGGDGLMGVRNAFPIGGWAPGADPYTLPEGLALEIPPGADFVFEIHYHLTGRATQDRSAVGLYLTTKDQVDRTIDGLYLATENIDIPAGEANYDRHLSIEIPADIDLIDISPHMHYLGTSARAVATRADGEEIPLINIADWDFRWQNVYVYRRPVRIPAGSRIDAWCSFDNSSGNRANPSSPPKDVRYGLQSTDEMCELYMSYVPVRPKDNRKVQRAMMESLRD